MRSWDDRPDRTTSGPVLPLERLVMETEIAGVMRFDRTGRVLRCNSTMARLLGAPAGELAGATLADVLDAPDAAAMLALVRSGREYVAGRVRLSFLGKARRSFVLECALALDGSGGALLGNPPQEKREGDSW